MRRHLRPREPLAPIVNNVEAGYRSGAAKLSSASRIAASCRARAAQPGLALESENRGGSLDVAGGWANLLGPQQTTEWKFRSAGRRVVVVGLSL